MRSHAKTFRFVSRRWLNRAANLLYPTNNKVCLLCQRPMYITASSEAHSHLDGVCLFCLQDAQEDSNRITVRSIRMRRPSRSNSQISIPQATQPAATLTVYCGDVYAGVIRHAIREWKYDGTIELTPWFASLVWAALREKLPDLPFDEIVPVPTSIDRYRKRGYDHVLILAHALRHLWRQQNGAPASSPQYTDSVDERLRQGGHHAVRTGRRGPGQRPDRTAKAVPSVQQRLIRRASASDKEAVQSFTQSQTAKNATERLHGLQGAYALAAEPHATAYGVTQSGVSGKRILLVDDVVTTGATLYTCASALYAGGAASVTAATIANVE